MTPEQLLKRKQLVFSIGEQVRQIHVVRDAMSDQEIDRVLDILERHASDLELEVLLDGFTKQVRSQKKWPMTIEPFLQFCRRHEIASHVGAFIATVVVALLLWGALLSGLGEL